MNLLGRTLIVALVALGCGVRGPINDAGSGTSSEVGEVSTTATSREEGGPDSSTSASSEESGILDTGDDGEPPPLFDLPDSGTGGDPIDQCLQACEIRRGFEESQGFCPFDWRGGVPCEEFCFEFLFEFPADRQEVVLECVARDPLCFQTLEQCVCNKLGITECS